MCVYTVKKQNLKNSSKGVRNSTERLKIRLLRCKGYAKTNMKIVAYHIA